MTIDPLKIRKNLKAKKPKFIMQDAHKKKRLSKKWKKPRGLQSKMRLEKKGYRRNVETGWGSPKEAKYLHSTGLQVALVSTVAEIAGINPKTQGIIIRSAVGQKKKVEIVKECINRKIRILNLKKAEDYKNIVDESLKKRKQDKDDRLKKKEYSKKELEKRAKEKEKKEKEEKNIEETLTDEDKKEREKVELDKTLTQTEF